MSVSEKVFPAFDVLFDERERRLKFDKTIQADIVEIKNLDTGEYRVKHSGNIFSVYAADVTQQFDVGDSVYIVVPEGDFSNRKVITTKVSSQSLSYNQLAQLQHQISEISPNILTALYQYSPPQDAIGVVAGVSVTSALGHADVWRDSSLPHDAFKQYANNYELLRIKASFLTRFQSVHTKGNYGLKVTFHTNENKEVSYFLDISSFNGDPYRLTSWSPQSVIVKTQKNYLTGLKSIELLQEDFTPDRFIVNGQQAEENTTSKNIFVKDIGIEYVEQKDLTDVMYYLKISTPQGNSLTNGETIDLVGQLIYQGKSILKEDNCTCTWYERDLSVTTGSVDFNKIAGYGWKQVDYNNFNVLSVDSSKVVHEKQFKLVVVYNENVTVSAEVEVFRTDSGYAYTIEQEVDGNNINLLLTKISGNGLLTAVWYVSYPDGSYVQLMEGQKANTILINDYLLYSSATFYAAVYAGDTLIGVTSHLIINSESQEDLTAKFNGEEQFRYDANGDIAIEDSERERTLQVDFTWRDGVASPYTVKWFAYPYTTPLTTDRTSVNYSMMQNVRVDNNGILHYTIRQKYRLDYNNNTIRVQVTTLDNKVYTFDKEVLFLKDGDQGTNGTTYVMAIRPCDSDGTKLSGFNPLKYNGSWGSKLRLGCFVYKDGVDISNQSYVTYEWDKINVSLEDTNVPYRKLVQGTSIPSPSANSQALEYYVKVKATITQDGRRNVVYASYPIDVIYGNLDASLVDIGNLPQYIKYTASGINPQYHEEPALIVYNYNPYRTIESKNPNLLGFKTRDNIRYLSPATSFIFEKKSGESSIAVLKCNVENNYIIHPVMMYLDTFGNEAINGWDGTTLDIDESDGHILAPQIGAGEKINNKFTGIVMGKDQAQNKVGLYGYSEGIKTFSLDQHGRAVFGKNGLGQIIIDPENGGVIKSANYDGQNTQGMKINLDDGIIETRSFKFDGAKQSFLFKLAAANNNSYFRIATTSESDDNTVFFVGKEQYYLQSEGFSNSTNTGTKIDLKNGDITSYDFSIKAYNKSKKVLELDSTSQKFFFDVGSSKSGGSFIIKGSTTNLFSIIRGGGHYILQSDQATPDFYLNLSTGELRADSLTTDGLVATNANISGDIDTNSMYAYKVNIKTSDAYTVTSSYGYLGMVEGSTGAKATYNIGIQTTEGNTQTSIILNSGNNLGLKATNGIWIQANEIHFQNISAANQHGIYARFAP